MSLFQRVNRRALTWDKVWGDEPGPTTASGKNVNEETSLKLSVVWAASTLISDAVSGLSPEAFRETEDGKHIAQPVPTWIRKPHPSLLRPDVFAQLMMGALLWGNGYAMLPRRESDGQPVAIMPQIPAESQCEWDKNKPGHRRYKFGNSPWLGEADVLHLQGPTLPGAATGLSVIQQAREAIGLGLTLEEFAARYFTNGSIMRGVIASPGKFDSTAADFMLDSFEKHHKGRAGWHRPGFLSGGATYVPITIPPNDAQFLESREFQAYDVARWFRVPPHRVGIISKATSWGSGLAEENTMLVQVCYRPWILRFEAALTSKTPAGEDSGLRIRLDDSELLRGTFKDQVEAWGEAVTARLATPNEGRKALGLDPLPGGDTLQPSPNDSPAKPFTQPDEAKPNEDAPEGDEAGERRLPFELSAAPTTAN